MWVVVLAGRARGRVGAVDRRLHDRAGPREAVAVTLHPHRDVATPRKSETAPVWDLVRRVEDATGAKYDWERDRDD